MATFKLVPLILSASLLLSACSTTNTTTDQDPGRLKGFDGHQRLSQDLTPLAYQLELEVDPTAGTISGRSQITIKVNRATRTLRLHAESLSISRATLSPLDAPQKSITATATLTRNGGLELVTPDDLEPREYALTLEFSSKLEQTPLGLYRVKEAERWYAFTQFEPLEARRAFPCFDEPRFKTPFTVSLTVPDGLLAFSNAPERAREPRELQGKPMTTFRFQTTQPLATYLVAFAVGDFDVVEAKGLPKKHVPLRVIAPKGKGALSAYALEKTPKILAALADFFGQAYPYDKLDLVAVPNFTYGAMENVGLVTFREGLLLLDPQKATISELQSTQGVIAHELAHMWFGDLVTPRWWDDLWLNESFATWMANYVLDQVAPELEAGARQIRGVGGLMSADSRPQTRAIRQPIRHGGDVYNAFDGMTYGKGAAVLGMLHDWIGHEAFVGALRDYMRDHAHGSVTTPALMEALSATSKRDVYAVVRGFVDQPGVPLIEVTPICESDKVFVELKQTRYTPAKTTLDPGKPWQIPMCFAWGDEGSTQARQRHCILLDKPSKRVDLPIDQCPAWFHPNADELGYYLWSLPQPNLMALATTHREQLTPREHIGLLNHIELLTQAQTLAPQLAYELATAWSATSKDPDTLSRVLGTLSSTYRTAQALDMMPQYRRLLAAQLSPHLERLGLEPREVESLAEQNLRSQIIETLGYRAKDPYIIANAHSLLPLFLKQPEQLKTFVSSWAIPLVVRHGGDPLLFDQLLALLKETQSPAVRAVALSALGHFSQPELQRRALDLFLTDDVRSNELWALLGPSFSEEDTYALTWSWIQAHQAQLSAKLGTQGTRTMPWLASGFCSEARAQEVEAYFKALPNPPTGQDRILGQVLSNIRRCETNRSYSQEAIKALLDQYTPAPAE